MLRVTIEKETIRVGKRFSVVFQRTLRIPDNGHSYPLPPGLGRFPISKIDDYVGRVPELWVNHGGAFIPMYQREALWLGFHAASWKPNAVIISIGGINVISGASNDETLDARCQNYIVCPEQPWLDGIHTDHGLVRQFVAMPLGLGYTVESSLTGREESGGIQIKVFEPKPGKFPDKAPKASDAGPVRAAMRQRGGVTPMGLGAGGTMTQKIYPDPYGIDVWDQDNYGHIVVHIINSAEYSEITQLSPPPSPIDAKTYTQYGLPWFDLYDENRADVSPSEQLAGVKTISTRDAERGTPTDDVSLSISETQIKQLRGKHPEESSTPDSEAHPPGRK